MPSSLWDLQQWDANDTWPRACGNRYNVWGGTEGQWHAIPPPRPKLFPPVEPTKPQPAGPLPRPNSPSGFMANARFIAAVSRPL
jgi:hypothetical protein